MANRLEISDEEGKTIHSTLAVHKHVRMASEASCRAFLVAALWVLRSGRQRAERRSRGAGLREVDWFVYRERHLIERFFYKKKHYRRISSRYEKPARNHMGLLRFVSALIWLR